MRFKKRNKKKSLNGQFIKEDMNPNSTWQNAQHYYSSKKYIIKPKWNAITYLLAWFKNTDTMKCAWGWRAIWTLNLTGENVKS